MKILTMLFNLFIVAITIHGQELTDKKWIKFHVDRADGSRIISRQNINSTYFEYTFNKEGEVTIYSSLGEKNLPYIISDSTIIINNFLSYKIERLENNLLVLVEIPKIKTDLDKINRVYFTTDDHYFENVFNLSLVTFNNDSTIIANNYIQPKFRQPDLYIYFMNEFEKLNIDSLFIDGSFILSPRREFLNLELGQAIHSDKHKEIKNIFLSTMYQWQPPIPNEAYYYLIKFRVEIKNGVIEDMEFFDNSKNKQYDPIGFEENNNAYNLYNEANKLLKKKRYEKAILYYTKCLKNDPIFLDAFYKRAEAYKALNMMDKACEDWKYLNELDQVKGVNIYNCNCKNEK